MGLGLVTVEELIMLCLTRELGCPTKISDDLLFCIIFRVPCLCSIRFDYNESVLIR
jgi:hypothetical protein